MGWSIPWISSGNTDFNFDMGASQTDEEAQALVKAVPEEEARRTPMRALAAASGTDVAAYISEMPAVSAFALQDGTVYQTYGTTWRGVEFLMGYYPILDRAPKGRDEDEAIQTWIRRHDEYEDASSGATG
jgi:predicted dithiol-disulfide oxidoreductase (DUF899 family)